jgi:hypothetical protein
MGAVGMCYDRATCRCMDDISLYVFFEVESFISCQGAVNEVCVSLETMEAKGNPIVPPNNEILNSHNEVPFTFLYYGKYSRILVFLLR